MCMKITYIEHYYVTGKKKRDRKRKILINKINT